MPPPKREQIVKYLLPVQQQGKVGPDHLPDDQRKFDNDWDVAIKVTKGAQFLAAGLQGPALVVWAKVGIVETERHIIEERVLCVRGTGQGLTGKEGRYLNSVDWPGRGITFHVFERED